MWILLNKNKKISSIFVYFGDNFLNLAKMFRMSGKNDLFSHFTIRIKKSYNKLFLKLKYHKCNYSKGKIKMYNYMLPGRSESPGLDKKKGRAYIDSCYDTMTTSQNARIGNLSNIRKYKFQCSSYLSVQKSH